MRAVVLRANGEPRDVVRVEEIPVPEPGPGRVRVRVAAAACNFPDVMMCRGVYAMRPDFPFTPGLEAAGEIVAVGEGVDPARLGDRVVAVAEFPHGALAEHAVLPAGKTYPVPDEVDFGAAAALLIAFQTAHVSLHRRGNLRAGETLLVHAAAGGVGSAAVQLGTLAGARVLAVASSPEKVARCLAMGADVGIDSSAVDFVEAANEATGGRGADVVFDPVGGEVFHGSRRCIAVDGRLLLVGFAGGETQTIPAGAVLRGNYSVVGVYLGAYSHDDAGRRFMLDVHHDLLGVLARGEITPVIDRRIGLDDVAGALTDLAERRVVGKIVVEP